MDEFEARHYNMSVKKGVDEFTVKKHDRSNWSEIVRTTHGREHGKVEFRSREALLMDKHMIDDMLREG